MDSLLKKLLKRQNHRASSWMFTAHGNTIFPLTFLSTNQTCLSATFEKVFLQLWS